MQNSFLFNDAARDGFKIHIPRKEPEEVKLPGIKPQTTINLSERDMEFNMHDRLLHYNPFKISKLNKKSKTITKRVRNVKSVK